MYQLLQTSMNSGGQMLVWTCSAVVFFNKRPEHYASECQQSAQSCLSFLCGCSLHFMLACHTKQGLRGAYEPTIVLLALCCSVLLMQHRTRPASGQEAATVQCKRCANTSTKLQPMHVLAVGIADVPQLIAAGHIQDAGHQNRG